jgi:DNA-binding beta-propeller fold protein YncE
MLMLLFIKIQKRQRTIPWYLLTKFRSTKNMTHLNTRKLRRHKKKVFIWKALSNAFEMHNCFICYSQLSKTVEVTNAHGHLFCSEQRLEHYNNNQGLYLPLIPEEVIHHIMIPLLDAKVLHYLKCADSKWRTKVEEYIKNSVPMFKFVPNFRSKGSGNGQFNRPLFLATRKQGDIYVSSCRNDKIQVFDGNKQWKMSIGSYGSGNGKFNHPTGIAFNSKSHMFVADCWNHRIVEFDQNMQFVKVFGSEGNGSGQFQRPAGITVDADDIIVVADSGNHRLQIFSKDGNWKQTIGKQGSGNGEFNKTWNVAVSKASGRIFVSDWNYRVQVFNSDGEFLIKSGSKDQKTENPNIHVD